MFPSPRLFLKGCHGFHGTLENVGESLMGHVSDFPDALAPLSG